MGQLKRGLWKDLRFWLLVYTDTRDRVCSKKEMKYKVFVTRTSFASMSFEVEAANEEEAQEIAERLAYNTDWRGQEHIAEYDIEHVETINSDV